MRLDSPLLAEGVKVPIWATFTGWRALPYLALGTNSYSPLFRLHEDRVEFKVIRTHARSYADIERVDARRLGRRGAALLTIEWRGQSLTLSASIHLMRLTVQVLGFFQDKGVPLSPGARALLAPAPPRDPLRPP